MSDLSPHTSNTSPLKLEHLSADQQQNVQKFTGAMTTIFLVGLPHIDLEFLKAIEPIRRYRLEVSEMLMEKFLTFDEIINLDPKKRELLNVEDRAELDSRNDEGLHLAMLELANIFIVAWFETPEDILGIDLNADQYNVYIEDFWKYRVKELGIDGAYTRMFVLYLMQKYYPMFYNRFKDLNKPLELT